MSAQSAASRGKGHGTTHFRMHSLSGWGVILGLPFAAIYAVMAVQDGADGVKMWLSSPLGAIGMTAFLSAAILYCKLEIDEVIMDYFSDGLRRFGLWKNSAVALILWLTSVIGLLSAAFL